MAFNFPNQTSYCGSRENDIKFLREMSAERRGAACCTVRRKDNGRFGWIRLDSVGCWSSMSEYDIVMILLEDGTIIEQES